ncbi:MAG: tandem-95 repeat protein, partial [Melioribacteraceae bacterium]
MKKYFYLFAFLVVGLTNIFAQTAPTSANNAVPGIEDTYLTVFSGDFTFNDVDPGDALASVLIEAVPTNGILFNDALVTDNGVYDVGEELVIGSVVSIADIVASQLMFLPNLDFNGADSFQFEVNDDSGVPPDQSTGNYIMTLNIAAVNDAPVAANNTITTSEDSPLVIVEANLGYSDVDADLMNYAEIVTLPALGTLFYDANNNAVVDGGDHIYAIGDHITPADFGTNFVRYSPPTDANGSPYTSFTFRVHDGTTLSVAANTMTINVVAVNDAPIAANNTVTTNKNIDKVFAAIDFGYSDVDADALSLVRVTAIPGVGTLYNDANLDGVVDGGETLINGNTVSLAQINASQLKFRPVPNANGIPYTTFTFDVNDGNVYSAATYTMTINVTNVNNAPTAANNTVTTAEDVDKVFAAVDFNYSDVDADAMTLVRVTAIPLAGTLYNDANLDGLVDVGETLINGNTVSLAQINAGQLKFRPVPNANGTPYTTFTFDVNDGTAYSDGTYTMTINVTSVNDAPTAANNTLTGTEDTDYTFAAGDFGYSDIDADAMSLVRVTVIPAVGTLYNDADLDGLVDVGETLINGNTVSLAQINAGQLKFRTVPNANGIPYTTFTFDVNDGTEYSASTYTMTINVTPVNDAPVL